MKTNTIRTRTRNAVAGAPLAVTLSTPNKTQAADQLAWDKTFPQSDKVIHQKVSFNNRLGINLITDLYIPKNLDRSKKHPAIVVGGPFGAVKEQSAGLYAQTMAERGFVTIAHDPSGDHAHSRIFSEQAFKKALEPKELYIVPNAGHVDLYDRVSLIPWTKLTSFFTEHLK